MSYRDTSSGLVSGLDGESMVIWGGGGGVWTPQLWKVFPLAIFSSPPSRASFFSPFPFPLHLRGFAACARPSSDAWLLGVGLPLGWLVLGWFLAKEAPGISGSRLEGHKRRSLPEDTVGLGLHPTCKPYACLRSLWQLSSGEETPELRPSADTQLSPCTAQEAMLGVS